MANIKDVAELAGVSPITVSRVFNHPELVSEKTMKVVMQAADQLMYMPNLLARSLVTNQSQTIGVFICRLENLLYCESLSGITQQANSLGYNVLIAYGHSVNESIKAIKVLLSKKIDGLILASVDFRPSNQDSFDISSVDDIQSFYSQLHELSDKYTKSGFPIISLNQFNGKDFPNCTGFIAHDYEAGTRRAIEHLVKNGHKKIGYLAHFFTDKGLWGVRYHSFFKAIEDLQCETREEWVHLSADTVDGGFAAMCKLLDQPELPTAIYCANDEIALGAINACHAKRISVPDEISIIGHDGNPIGLFSFPKLTTVSIHYKEMGMESVNMVIDFIGNKKFSYSTRFIRPTLEGRGSVTSPS